MTNVQKKITLDPNYLSLLGSKKQTKRTSQKHKIKTKTQPGYSSKTLRKKLIEKIKTYQNKQDVESLPTPIKDTPFDNADDLNDSIKFLQELSEKKKNKRNKQNKNTNTVVHASNMIAYDSQTAPLREDSYASSAASVSDEKNNASTSIPININTEQNRVTLKHTQPEYSCLKGGSRPTFREWKNMTQRSDTITKNPTHIKITIPSDNPLHTNSANEERSNNLNQLKHKFKQIMHSKPAVQKICVAHRKIRTVKYKLGKNGKNVGVLIKNTDTRRKIKHEISLLRQKAIVEVKQYLRDKNLLKSGSDAPNDVLRQMYEQAVLSGELNNTSDDNLLHNFMNN